MKRNIIFLCGLYILLLSSNSYSQLAKTSWGAGVGFTYPRFVAITPPSHTGYNNFGGYLSLQRNFSEYVAIRLSANYNHIESLYSTNLEPNIHQKLNAFTGDADLLYYLLPCEVISPYLVGGFGGIIYNSKNSPQKEYNGTSSAYQFNLGIGGQLRVTNSLNVTAEFTYNIGSNNKLDGRNNNFRKGLFNTTADDYARLSVGLVYLFSKGEPSHLCDLYEGVTKKIIIKPEKIDYNKIEEMIKKYMPKKQPPVVSVPAPVKRHWVLIGVNFNFNSAKLRPEAYPVLIYAIQILNNEPDMKVQIQGYTDSIGTAKYNLKLSQRRAETVMNYLISHGISQKRLTAKGFGEADPIASNKTKKGRSANRRIEFKILNQ